MMNKLNDCCRCGMPVKNLDTVIKRKKYFQDFEKGLVRKYETLNLCEKCREDLKKFIKDGREN